MTGESVVPRASVDRSRRRGPVTLPAEEARRHCVSVRLNVQELRLLDEKRDRHQRGEWLRLAALDRLPPPPPPALNREAWTALDSAAGNLNQIAKHLNAMSQTPGLENLVAARDVVVQIAQALGQFRAKLHAAEASLTPVTLVESEPQP